MANDAFELNFWEFAVETNMRRQNVQGGFVINSSERPWPYRQLAHTTRPCKSKEDEHEHTYGSS